MTRFLIAKQVGPDAYRTIAGLCDGYLEHTGSILLTHYSNPEILDRLLDLGDIHFLDRKLEPDTSHRLGIPQEGVTKALARDFGDKNTEAAVLTLKQLDDPKSFNDFIYIFTEANQWVYFQGGMSEHGLLDLRDSVDRVINAVPPKIVSAPQRRYYDANKKEIFADMHIRFPNGTVEKVYATQDAEGNPDLGINASNDAYMRRHGIPEAEREFYSLSSVDLHGVEICEPVHEEVYVYKNRKNQSTEEIHASDNRIREYLKSKDYENGGSISISLPMSKCGSNYQDMIRYCEKHSISRIIVDDMKALGDSDAVATRMLACLCGLGFTVELARTGDVYEGMSYDEPGEGYERIRNAIQDYMLFEEDTSEIYPFAATYGELSEETIRTIVEKCDGYTDTESIYIAIDSVVGTNPELCKEPNESREGVTLANVITNILTFEGTPQQIQEIKAAVQDDELGYGSFDFNKVIPTPPSITQAPIPFEELRNRNAPNWFNWNRDNWGCRDNAHGFYRLLERASPEKLLFEVGWTPPHKVIQKLSERYPDITIIHQWADDNIGFDCGLREYKAGEYTEAYFQPGSREAYEYAVQVIDIDLAKDKQMYLSEDGTTYEYREDYEAVLEEISL